MSFIEILTVSGAVVVTLLVVGFVVLGVWLAIIEVARVLWRP